MAEGKINWLASYPKSGNTWFRIFLSYYLSENPFLVHINKLPLNYIFSSRQIIEDYTGYDISELTMEESNRLRREAFIGLATESEKIIFVKTHDAFHRIDNQTFLHPVDATCGAVYFIRNPWDVAVSFANHLSGEIPGVIEKMCNTDFSLASSAHKYSPQIRQKLFSWGEHVRTWTDGLPFPVKIVRYEDMLGNTARVFTEILEFLSIPFEINTFEQALALSQFDRIKKMEEMEGFREKPPQCEKFFKNGTKGYFYQFLSDDEIKRIKDEFHDVLIVNGYLSNNDEIIC